jgi:anaerobic magnesium-protoporphyrin IX monomethyl ester cyclase
MKKGKKILIASPIFHRSMNFSANGIPLGSLYLAGELKKRGHDVKVLDDDYNPGGTPYNFIDKSEHFHDYTSALKDPNHSVWENVSNVIGEYEPDVLGLSVVTPKFPSSLITAQIARKLKVKKIIAGGPHASFRPYDFINTGLFDSVVRFEGENVFEDAMNGSGIFTGKRIGNLDSLAMPDRNFLIGLGNYNKRDLGNIMTGRGCPYACNFCGSPGLWDRRVVNRSIENVVAEMNVLSDKHKVNEFYINDDTFTVNKKRVYDFCNSIKDKNWDWHCLTRANVLDDRKLKKMKNAGCTVIKIGVESGSQRILNLMNKNANVEEVERVGDLLNRNKMPWLAYIMVGIPGETEKDVDMTINLIKKTAPSYVAFAVYAPYPGTGFSNEDDEEIDWGEVSHDSWRERKTSIPVDKIEEVAKFVDKYNAYSKKASEMFNRSKQ